MALAYSDLIYSCYNNPGTPASNFNLEVGRPITQYKDNMAFNRYMKIDISKDVFEIPCIYKYLVGYYMKYNRNQTNPNSKYDIINIPIIISGTASDTSHTTNPLLKLFFRESSTGTLLKRKKVCDTYYIGGEGIIMYDDFTPMIMFTLEVQKIKVDDCEKYIPIRQILRINPIIYSKNDTIAKHIKSTMIKNIIPMKLNYDNIHRGSWLYSRLVLRDYYNLFADIKLNWDFKIIIEDFSDWFTTPTIPDCNFKNSDANKFLLENYNDIIEQL